MLINVTSRYKYGVHVNIFFILVFFNFSFINSDLFRLTNLINVFFFWKNGNIRTDRFFSRFGFGKFYFLLIAIVKIANSENFYWNANFLPNNFDFFTKVRLFTKRCWPKFEFLLKISIFAQNFDFYPKFRFLPKISIFTQNFDFCPKFRFLPKILNLGRFFYQIWSIFFVKKQNSFIPVHKANRVIVLFRILCGGSVGVKLFIYVMHISMFSAPDLCVKQKIIYKRRL